MTTASVCHHHISSSLPSAIIANNNIMNALSWLGADMSKLTSPTRKSPSSTGKEGTQQHLINLCDWAVEDCAGVQFTDLQLEKCNIEGCDEVSLPNQLAKFERVVTWGLFQTLSMASSTLASSTTNNSSCNVSYCSCRCICRCHYSSHHPPIHPQYHSHI